MHLKWIGEAIQKQYVIKYSKLLQLTSKMSSPQIEKLISYICKLNYEENI